VPKSNIVPCVSNYPYAKFGEIWTARSSPIRISKCGCLKTLINKKMLGPACQTQWPIKQRPIAGLTRARQLLGHAPAARALSRTSVTCATPCALIHCAWLQWRTSPPLWLLLAPSHRPHSSVADHCLAATGHRRAPSTPSQRPPVSQPSSRAAGRRPPPQDVALIALFRCLCFTSAECATPVSSSIRRFSLRFTAATASSYHPHPSSLRRNTGRSSKPP
jgi:hypothetical protein